MKKIKYILSTILPVIIYMFFITHFINTFGDYIKCDKSGKCSLYTTSFFHFNHHVKEVEFMIFDNSKIMCKKIECECQKTHNFAHLIISTNNNYYNEIPRTIRYDRCNLYKSILETNISNDDKTLNYFNKYGHWYDVIIFSLIIFVGIIISKISLNNKKE